MQANIAKNISLKKKIIPTQKFINFFIAASVSIL